MRLKEALRKYSDDMYKRSELVRGRLAVRRIPYAYSKQGYIETYLSNAISDHTARYALGRVTGTMGYLIDSDKDAPTLRCSAITFIRAEKGLKTGEGDFGITPPDVAIEFINQPHVKEYGYPLPIEQENEDSENYWPEKLADYQRFGVGRLWLIDLTREEIYEFRQPEWRSRTLKGSDTLEGGEDLPGWHCQVADIFDPEKLRAGLGLGWKAPLDTKLIVYVFDQHQKTGLERKLSVAELELLNQRAQLELEKAKEGGKSMTEEGFEPSTH